MKQNHWSYSKFWPSKFKRRKMLQTYNQSGLNFKHKHSFSKLKLILTIYLLFTPRSVSTGATNTAIKIITTAKVQQIGWWIRIFQISACNRTSWTSQVGLRSFCTSLSITLMRSCSCPVFPQRKASWLWGANSLPQLRAVQTLSNYAQLYEPFQRVDA